MNLLNQNSRQIEGKLKASPVRGFIVTLYNGQPAASPGTGDWTDIWQIAKSFMMRAV